MSVVRDLGVAASATIRTAEANDLQEDVLKFVRAGSGHGVVQATAGSGKTTTLVRVAQQLPAGTRACFLAFNRSITAELQARLPGHVDATTLHALGRSAAVKAFPSLRGKEPNNKKYLEIARELTVPLVSEASVAIAGATYLAALAQVARLTLTPADDPAKVPTLARQYQLLTPTIATRAPELNARLHELLERGVAAAAAGNVDFTDMLYLPVTLDLRLPQYELICVDEAQDLSPLSFALIRRLLATNRGARGLFVGDPHQAIYGFAGAQAKSLEHVTKTLGATVLPLSVSYRCPARHVTLARRFSPEMKPHRTSAPGEVHVTTAAHLPKLVKSGDLVLSRVNAPLTPLALELTAARIPTHVLGLDLITPTLELARQLFGRVLPAWPQEVVQGSAREKAYQLELTSPTDPRLGEELLRLTLEHRALTVLLERLPPRPRRALADLERVANALWGSTGTASDTKDRPAPVLLSTVHKAKGREAVRVFLLYPEELAPHPPPTHDGVMPQPATSVDTFGLNTPRVDTEAEANVLFVALTRARHALYLVERAPGSLAARLSQRAHVQPPQPRNEGSVREAQLAEQWSEILSLAVLMHKVQRTPAWAPLRSRSHWARQHQRSS